MADQIDDTFYHRADAHIELSNGQITDAIDRGKVSASMMYATARFNAWVSACGFVDPELLRMAKPEAIEYFTTQYRKMLEANFDDYVDNFERYMKSPAQEKNA